MKAKFVYESINFERGRDPKTAMGIGAFETLPERIFEADKNSGYYMDDRENNIRNIITANTRMIVNFLDNPLREPGSRKIISKVNYLKKLITDLGFIDRFSRWYEEKGAPWRVYFTLAEGRYPMRKEYDIRFYNRIANESINFERGQDPKDAMGIGQWKDGYKIEKYPDFDNWNQGANNLLDWSDFNWDKKVGNIEDLYGKTEVTPDLEPNLYQLPVVDFKYYYDGNSGLLGDWPDDFPFKNIPFIANVEEDDGRTFLISPEGYTYARYMTELV